MTQKSLDDRLSTIEKLRQRGNTAQAQQQIQNLLIDFPEHPSALNLLALIHHDAGNSAEAMAILEKISQQHPQVWLPIFNLAVIAMDCKDYARAEAALDAALPLHPQPENIYRGYEKIYIKTRNFSRLLGTYIQLLTIGKLRNKDRPNFFRSMENATLFSYFPEVENEILRYIDETNHDPEALRQFISAQLNDKYADIIGNIDNGIDSTQLNRLAEDTFLHRILHEIIFSQVDLELWLQAIRRGLLSTALTDGEIPDNWLHLVEAIAAQNWMNEFIASIDDDEQTAINQIINNIETHCDTAGFQSAEISTTLLLAAMYMDPDKFSCRDQLLATENSDWPSYVRPVLSRLKNQQKIRELVAHTPSLSAIDNQVSQKVQAQYEENPYPRWQRCARIITDNIGTWMSEILPHYIPHPILSNASIRILIAGCGTGKQVAQIARSFPHAQILAVDLSRASLAYARYKASQYNLKNIEFLHADILELTQLTQRFDVIFCTGVLHHMSAIEPGWRILRDLLNPNGVMQIAVYSRLARQDIAEIRKIIAENSVPATLEGIRAVRDLVFAGQLPNVSKSRDFYSTSNCRDLLFHVQEICSDIPDLQRMLVSLDLEFLGFDLLRVKSDLVKSAVTNHSLSDWQKFEEQHPCCFEAMYHLWCTPNNHNLEV